MSLLIRSIVTEEEDGHALPAVGALAGSIGAIVLAIGAANDSGVTAVVGGILLAAGLMAASLLDHMFVEYDIFGRLEKLEGTKKD